MSGAEICVQQLSLPGAEEMFAAVGLETLPHGAGDLTKKQLEFVLAYLECGSERAAARKSGYAEQHASKVMRTGAVARFLRAAIRPVAQNGDQLVRRKWELSVAYHAEIMRLRSKPFAERTDAELRREVQVAAMAVRNDTLLAAMLNRLGVRLTGEVQMNHTATGGGDFIVVPPDALRGFAAARAEVVAYDRVAGSRNVPGIGGQRS